MVDFNKEQIEIIKYSQPEMLIKGVAGSGKTLCLLFNAIEKSREKSGIYFFTYNNTLKKYIEDFFSTGDIKDVHVTTFHSWALDKIRSIYPKARVVWGKRRNTFLETAIKKASKEHSGRFITDKDYRSFLLDEIDYLNNQYISELEEYLALSRIGRGTEVRLSKEDRQEIFSIFTYYQLEKFKKNSIEFAEFASILLDNIDKIDGEMNHVFIDEAQDLDKAQLLLLRKLAKESFYLAADKGQKIYNTNYSWKEIGINIRGGRTKNLTKSYRTTEQILRLAQSLQTNDVIIEDQDYTEAQMKDMRQGPVPELILYEKSDYKDSFIRVVKDKLARDKVVGILVGTWYEAGKLEEYLAAEGIPYEVLKKGEGTSLVPGVKITTMFSSKGLEFDDVIISNFTFEKRLDLEDTDAMNLSRRLYYVSFTRSRDSLTIFVPRKTPSVFYSELDENLYMLR